MGHLKMTKIVKTMMNRVCSVYKKNCIIFLIRGGGNLKIKTAFITGLLLKKSLPTNSNVFIMKKTP